MKRHCLTSITFILALLLTAFPISAQYQRNPLPVPDVNGYKALKCDFHLHTVFSDGRVWPTLRVIEAYEQGLDVISITDHDDYHPWTPHVSEDLTQPYEIAKPLAESLGILLIPGIEITKGEWHFNALFLEDRNVTKDLEKKDALLAAKKQGAFVFWNHPGWKRPERWFPEIEPLWDSRLFSGVEMINGKNVFDGIYGGILERKLAIVANTDAHGPIGEDEIEGRPITLVFASTADSQGVREALEARRTAGWTSGQVWGSEELLKGLWSGAVTMENPDVTLQPGGSYTLRLVNTSALRFDLQVTASPEWLSFGAGSIPSESGVTAPIRAADEAPEGRHAIELELEITNFHTGPGQNVVVEVPLQVTVAARPLQ